MHMGIVRGQVRQQERARQHECDGVQGQSGAVRGGGADEMTRAGLAVPGPVARAWLSAKPAVWIGVGKLATAEILGIGPVGRVPVLVVASAVLALVVLQTGLAPIRVTPVSVRVSWFAAHWSFSFARFCFSASLALAAFARRAARWASVSGLRAVAWPPRRPRVRAAAVAAVVVADEQDAGVRHWPSRWWSVLVPVVV